MLIVPAFFLSRDFSMGWKLLASIDRTSESGFNVAKMVLLALLAVFTRLAARVAQLARSDPRCGVPKKAIAQVQSRIWL
jgi:hypothetical protein